MKRLFATTFALATFVALLSSALDAGKPQPPPPPPPPGPEVYQWRPDLGGMLDTSRNLIWGYEGYALSGGTAPYDFLNSQNYPAIMQSTAGDFYDQADYYSGIGDTETAALYDEAAGFCEDAPSVP